MTLRGYYSTNHGHYCATEKGHYKMDASWIDTDNKVWSEPYHLYTESRPQPYGKKQP